MMAKRKTIEGKTRTNSKKIVRLDHQRSKKKYIELKEVMTSQMMTKRL